MTDTPPRGPLPETLQGPPSGYFVVMSPAGQRDLIDMGALIGTLLASWRLILAAAVLGALVAAAISLQMRPKFRAQALVSPVSQGESGAAGALRNQFGGIAALAGINLGSAGGRNEEALATFESDGFARDFITQENLLPILFADRWDAARMEWEGGKPPTMEAAVTKFSGDVRTISQDRQTGLLTVTVEWYSPELSAAWANRMVEMVNERLRAEAKQSAERSIEYLNQELGKTSVVDLRQAIYRLIQDQVNNAMLANVQREYAFRFIDRAVAPVTRASPKRTLLTAAGGFAGGFLGVLFVLVRHFRRVRRAESPLRG